MSQSPILSIPNSAALPAGAMLISSTVLMLGVFWSEFVTHKTMGFFAIVVTVLLAGYKFKVVRIYAPFITAFMVDLESFRNLTNEATEREFVSRFEFVTRSIEAGIPSIVNPPFPIPASGCFVDANSFCKPLQRWLIDSCRHKQNPTCPAKVKSAERLPQSWSKLENEILSFCGHFKAAPNIGYFHV